MIFRPLISSLRPALGLLSIALAVSACGIGVKKKKGRKVDQPKVVRVFIHGDPMQLVNGTALITQSIFPAGDGLDSFNDFDLIPSRNQSQCHELRQPSGNPYGLRLRGDHGALFKPLMLTAGPAFSPALPFVPGTVT